MNTIKTKPKAIMKKTGSNKERRNHRPKGRENEQKKERKNNERLKKVQTDKRHTRNYEAKIGITKKTLKERNEGAKA